VPFLVSCSTMQVNESAVVQLAANACMPSCTCSYLRHRVPVQLPTYVDLRLCRLRVWKFQKPKQGNHICICCHCWNQFSPGEHDGLLTCHVAHVSKGTGACAGVMLTNPFVILCMLQTELVHYCNEVSAWHH